MYYLTRTCIDVVRDIVDKRIQEDYPNPEEEQADLKRLGDEAEEWVKQAGLILEGVENVTEGEGGDKEEKNEESKERKEVLYHKKIFTIQVYCVYSSSILLLLHVTWQYIIWY